MRRFHLIRHAEPDTPPDILNGRLPGRPLSAKGRIEAHRLAHHFHMTDWTSLLSSPLERCLETAHAIAGQREAHPCIELVELDYGAWSGRSFVSLQTEPLWSKWNSDRGRAQTVGGDSLARVATSLIGLLNKLPPHGTFLLVTHAEVIRVFVALALNLSLTHSMAFEIDHASISSFEDANGYMRCLGVNRSAMS